jgi:myosin protein heavy chain
VQNLESTLASAHQQVKEKDLEARGLQATLESVSHQSDGLKTTSSKLQQEKNILEIRVRELEASIQHSNTRQPSPVRKRSRQHRSSSLSEFVDSSLQKELDTCRVSLAKKEADLLSANEKLTALQKDLLILGNGKVAMQRTLELRLKSMEESLHDTEEELQFLKMQQGGDGSSREEELLRRIDEDQAKISALELMIRDDRELVLTKEALKRTEQKLRAEIQNTTATDARLTEVVRQKEEALDERDDARRELQIFILEKEKEMGLMTYKER